MKKFKNLNVLSAIGLMSFMTLSFPPLGFCDDDAKKNITDNDKEHVSEADELSNKAMDASKKYAKHMNKSAQISESEQKSHPEHLHKHHKEANLIGAELNKKALDAHIAALKHPGISAERKKLHKELVTLHEGLVDDHKTLKEHYDSIDQPAADADKKDE